MTILIGPILPINIAMIIMIRPIFDKYGVIPVVMPVVPKADVVSNNISIKLCSIAIFLSV